MADLIISFYLWLLTVLLDLLCPCDDYGRCEMEDPSINQQEQEQEQLPIDLVTETLSLLPVRSVLRCKTVCKSWNEIISSPSFAELHLHNHYNTPTSSSNDTCIFLHRTTQNWKLSMVLPDGPGEFPLVADYGLGCLEGISFSESNIDIVGPVNGLICFYRMDSLYDRIALCNPCLRKTETLPRCPSTIPSSHDPLVINFECSFRWAGLGFDPARNDVKVVQVLSHMWKEESVLNHVMLVDMYSRNSGTWKKLEAGVPNDIWVNEPIPSPNNVSFCQWAAMRRCVDGTGRYKISHVVLSLDVRDEVFECTPLPDKVSDSRKIGVKIFGGRGNSLVVVCWPRSRQLFTGGNKIMCIWVLSGLGKERQWTLMSAVIGPLLYKSVPVGLWKAHELVLRYVEEGRLVIYDCYSGEIRNIDNSQDWNKCKVVQYKESLVSPASPALFRYRDSTSWLEYCSSFNA